MFFAFPFWFWRGWGWGLAGWPAWLDGAVLAGLGWVEGVACGSGLGGLGWAGRAGLEGWAGLWVAGLTP